MTKKIIQSCTSHWAHKKTWSLIFYFLFSIFYLAGCGLDVEDPTPPSPPVWVQKSLPEDWPERGIDSHESESIYLEWEANSDEDITGYNIYRAEWFDTLDSLGDYDLLAHLKTKSIESHFYIDQSAKIRTRYYFKLKAFDSSNNLSDYSDSLTYMLLFSVLLERMTPNGITAVLGGDRILSWGSSYHSMLEDYVLTIVSTSNELIIRREIQPRDYAGGDELWQIPTYIELVDKNVYKWRVDKGANYVDGCELTGSESNWAFFVFEE